MRPLYLKLSGIHSFRETQEVDFTALSDRGIFGIFGPTGSGKSTVLDAITLSLYGKVERANRDTQGILNQAENKLAVEFTFELGPEEMRRRYRVRRNYMRTGEHTVSNTASRLSFWNEASLADEKWEPIADKAADVNAKIQEILGLTFEDFTRAVVLPQGKFNQFLQLKGTERRRMLQRIFQLEAYGDQLANRLTNRLKQTNENLGRVAGEQHGLGDASPEAVRRAQEACQRAERQTAKAKLMEQETRSAFEVKKNVWTWQQEMTAVQKEKAVQLAKTDDIALLEERLEQARKADAVGPILEEAANCQLTLSNAQQFLEAAEELRKQIAGELWQTQERYKAAHQERAEKEPGLLEEKSLLERALKLEEELLKGKNRLGELEAYLKKVESKLALDQEKKAQGQARKDFLEKSIEQARLKVSQLTVRPEIRRAVEDALASLGREEAAKKEEAAAIDNWQKKKEHVNTWVEKADQCSKHRENLQREAEQEAGRLEELRANPPVEESRLDWQVGKLHQLKLKAGDIRHLLSQQEELFAREAKQNRLQQELLTELEQSEKQTVDFQKTYETEQRKANEQQETLERQEEQAMAAYLANSLQEGVPCPVCGASHHPAPREKLDYSLENLRAALKQARESAKNAEVNWHKAIILQEGLSEKVAQASRDYNEIKSKRDSFKDRLKLEWEACAALTQELQVKETVIDQWGLQQLQSLIEDLEQELAQKRDALSEWNRQRESARTALEQSREKAASATSEHASALSSLTASQEALEEARNRKELAVEGSRVAISGCEAALTYLNGLLEAPVLRESLPEKALQLAHQDEEIARATQEIEANSEEMTMLTNSLGKLAEAIYQSTLDSTRLQTELGYLSQQVNELEDEVHSLTGGTKVKVKMEQVAASLDRLRREEANTQTILEKTRQKVAETEEKVVEKRTSLNLAQEAQKRASLKLQTSLQQAGFADEATVRQAVLAEAEQTAMEKDVIDFKKTMERLDNEEDRLKGLLAGRTLSVTEWLAWQEKLARAQEALSEALSHQGGMEQYLNDVQGKHLRWTELEQERRGLVGKQHKLVLLQGLFRGNAFVEYIAEEQLANIAYEASQRLSELTRHRYALELDADGGFIMRDDANGGVRRPVNSLSGGETFLTSLALALALSAQIQLRGQFPLEFFFLDEGFGTLDPEALDLAVSTLERLHQDKLTIGVISHVPELKARLARRLVVEPAYPGAGSRLRLESA